MFSESNLKLLVIALMSFLLLFLLWSGLEFFNGNVLEYKVWHVSAALFFCVLVLIHIYLRRKKIKKMLQESFTGKSSGPHILKDLKQYSLNEICHLLDYDKEMILAFLITKDISITNHDMSLNKIASQNDYDPFKLLSLITAIHINNKDK